MNTGYGQSPKPTYTPESQRVFHKLNASLSFCWGEEGVATPPAYARGVALPSRSPTRTPRLLRQPGLTRGISKGLRNPATENQSQRGPSPPDAGRAVPGGWVGIKNNKRPRPSTLRSGGRPKTLVARLVRDSLSVYPANCPVALAGFLYPARAILEGPVS